jgi:hypothetical protein
VSVAIGGRGGGHNPNQANPSQTKPSTAVPLLCYMLACKVYYYYKLGHTVVCPPPSYYRMMRCIVGVEYC